NPELIEFLNALFLVHLVVRPTCLVLRKTALLSRTSGKIWFSLHHGRCNNVALLLYSGDRDSQPRQARYVDRQTCRRRGSHCDADRSAICPAHPLPALVFFMDLPAL